MVKSCLPPGDDDPERNLFPHQFFDLRRPTFFERREMNVAFELSGFDLKSKSLVQELGETVEEMHGRAVAAVDEGILAFD